MIQLKEYQLETLKAVRVYLEALAELRAKDAKARAIDPELGIDWPAKAWEKVKGASYHPRRNGLRQPLPSFCLKIPTGGGKTLLATKAIDLINTHFRKSNRGLVLWIVPTTQIYNQTLGALKDRDHPYRQTLDNASGARTLILERTQHFSPADIAGNLCVLVLMLPAAARQTKETLRMFRDSGGFDAFFPSEEDYAGHSSRLNEVPNLDTFDTSEFAARQIKTSLGNTLRTLSPLIILDEGQKAYSQLARETIEGFNPCMIVELSATPPLGANVLVDVKGTALEREGMIKLDLHVHNDTSVDWKKTLLHAAERRDLLEEQAREHEAQTGKYIRPICLIQVERTGKEQRGGKHIHAEDVREYLHQRHGVTADMVAIKTSEKDELKEVDNVGGLLSRHTAIRYIITKQALQEGWDCPFVYVLAVLTNPGSRRSPGGKVSRCPVMPKTVNAQIGDVGDEADEVGVAADPAGAPAGCRSRGRVPQNCRSPGCCWMPQREAQSCGSGFAGLESVELHLQRVAAQVEKGGHDIPASDIRKRWTCPNPGLASRAVRAISSGLKYSAPISRRYAPPMLLFPAPFTPASTVISARGMQTQPP